MAFSDDDSWWEPGALPRAARLFDRYPALGLLAARTLVGPAHVERALCAIEEPQRHSKARRYVG